MEGDSADRSGTRFLPQRRAEVKINDAQLKNNRDSRLQGAAGAADVTAAGGKLLRGAELNILFIV